MKNKLAYSKFRHIIIWFRYAHQAHDRVGDLSLAHAHHKWFSRRIQHIIIVQHVILENLIWSSMTHARHQLRPLLEHFVVCTLNHSQWETTVSFTRHLDNYR